MIQFCDDGDFDIFNDEVIILDCDGFICIFCVGILCNFDLELVVIIIYESCFGENDGSIVIDLIIGGQVFYFVFLNNSVFMFNL